MKRVFAAVAGVAFAAVIIAPAMRAAILPDPVTIRGQVVDIACYKEGKKGKDHDDCAKSCAKRGQPAAIVAADGLYVITGRFIKNKNDLLIDFVNKTVDARGVVTIKDGQKTIEAATIVVVKTK